PAARFGRPSPSTVDSHPHTLRSDGLLTPAELVRAASDVGVRLLAITDHDTLAGGGEVLRAPRPDGLELVAGIEINTVIEDRSHVMEGEVHILGLGVDPDDGALEAALSRQRDARRLRFDRMVDKLRAKGIQIAAAVDTVP